MRQSPLDFFTRTVFESHYGHLTSRIKLAFNNFSTSSCTTFCLSGPIFLFFCRIGLILGIICNLCSVISRGILGISDGDQANMFLCNCRKFTNLSRAAPCMVLPIFIVHPALISPAQWLIDILHPRDPYSPLIVPWLPD
jgi:hypothetical protein